MEIQTDRLIVRPFRPDDWRDLVDYLSLPANRRRTGSGCGSRAFEWAGVLGRGAPSRSQDDRPPLLRARRTRRAADL
jgi:hypothetical protein